MQIQNNNQINFGSRDVLTGDLSLLGKSINRAVKKAQIPALSLGDDKTNIIFTTVQAIGSTEKKGLVVMALDSDQFNGGKVVPSGTAIGYPRTENGVIKLIKRAVRDLEFKRQEVTKKNT